MPIIAAEQQLQDTHVLRKELRYLINEPENYQAQLVQWSDAHNTYKVTTLYMDSKLGTWSIGEKASKMRLRRYNDEIQWWLEIKTNVQHQVEKDRHRIELSNLETFEIVPVSMVTYMRQEFEKDNMRITLDADITCWQVPVEMSVSELADSRLKPTSRIVCSILETKGDQKSPVKLPKRWKYSKSRWSLAYDLAPSMSILEEFDATTS